MGFSQTRLGTYARRMSKLKKRDIFKVMFTDMVLAQMADLNTENQLRKGVKADGSIFANYSDASVAMGKPAGPIRLYDTGEFYSSIEYHYNGKLIATYDAQKEDVNLVEEYGNIIGLNEKSIEDIKPEILENIRAVLLPR